MSPRRVAPRLLSSDCSPRATTGSLRHKDGVRLELKDLSARAAKNLSPISRNAPAQSARSALQTIQHARHGRRTRVLHGERSPRKRFRQRHLRPPFQSPADSQGCCDHPLLSRSVRSAAPRGCWRGLASSGAACRHDAPKRSPSREVEGCIREDGPSANAHPVLDLAAKAAQRAARETARQIRTVSTAAACLRLARPIRLGSAFLGPWSLS